MIKADFGSIIATKRKECKLSQPQLAALMCKKGFLNTPFSEDERHIRRIRQIEEDTDITDAYPEI